MDNIKNLALVFFFLLIGIAPSVTQESTLLEVSRTYPEPENRSISGLIVPGAFSAEKLPSGRIQPQIMGRLKTSGFHFTPDGQYLAGIVGNLIVYYDVTDGRLIDSVAVEASSIRDMVFSADGKEIILSTDGSELTVVNALTGRTLRSLQVEDNADPYYKLYISPDGNRIAALSSYCFDDYFSTGVTVWDFSTGDLLWSKNFDLADVINLSFNTDSSRLLVPFRDDYRNSGYREFNAHTGELLEEVVLDESDFSSSGHAPHMLFRPLTDQLLYTHEDLGTGFLNRSSHELEEILYRMRSRDRHSRPVFSKDGSAFALSTEAELLLLTGYHFSERVGISMEREEFGRYESMPLIEAAFDPTGEYLFALSEIPFLYHIPTEKRIPLQTAREQEFMGMEFLDQGDSLYCLSKSGKSIYVTQWEHPGDPNQCEISSIVTLPFLEMEEIRFHGYYSLLDSHLGILLIEQGAVVNADNSRSFEFNIYSGETGDFLFNIRNISLQDDIAVSPDGKQILFHHMSGRYGDFPYHLYLSFFDLEKGEITDHQVHDLSGMVPENIGPYGEFFLNQGIFIDEDTMEFDFYSDSYWSGQGPCTKIRWNLGEPFDLEELEDPNNQSPRRARHNSQVSGGSIQAIFGENGSIFIKDLRNGNLLNTLYMLQPNVFVALDSSGTLYSESSRTSLFPVVDDLQFGEPVPNPTSPLFTGTVNNNGLRVRSLPNLQGKVLGEVNQGDQVKVYRQSDQPMTIGDVTANWYFITSESGLAGWIFGHYLDGSP